MSVSHPVHGHIIGGDRTPSADGRTFDSTDPATGEVIASLAAGSAPDVDHAVAAARAAQPEWAAMDPMDRTRLLIRLAEAIEANAEQLSQLESREVGKPLGEAVRDVSIAVQTWLYNAGWPTKLRGTTNPASPGVLSYTMREPLGVVGAITPWNFPLVIGSWKLAPALACGNTVVHKPSEEASLSSLRLSELALEVGFPSGVWNVVTGTGTVGAALSAHDGVDKVSFTGSTETGRAIQRAAAGNLKHLTLELGGKSANVVLADADLDAALQGAMRATFRNQGQVCTAGGRLILEEPIAEEFTERLTDQVGRLVVGPGSDPATQVGPLVSARQREHVLALYTSAIDEGAVAAVGGGPAVVSGYPDGHFVQPSVFVGTHNHMRINTEEIFGPAVSIIKAADEQEAVRIANDSPFGLAAAVWTRDVSRAHKVAAALQTGTVWINMYGGLDPYAAYGGRGLSGYGYEQGPETINEYTGLKTIRSAL